MPIYEVTKEVKLRIEAKNKREAAKFSSEWAGETSSYSTNGCNIEWNRKSKILGVEVKK